MSAALTCVYVTDEGFLPCTSFSIVSLCATASIPLEVHIVYAGQDERALEKAAAYLSQRRLSVRITRLPQTALAGLKRPQSLPLATYGRLLMHEVLPVSPERLLYIDGDTLVDIDVAPLATLSLEDRTAGAVLDIGRVLIGRREEAQRRLGLGPDGDYFNAGVLLVDWPRWRAKHIGERALEALAATPDRFTQADQCALNLVCRGDWLPLALRWNYQPEAVVHADIDRAIFHFLGGRKPWVGGHNRHPARFLARYQQLLAASPWSDQQAAPALPYAIGEAGRLAAHRLSTRYWSRHGLFRRTVARYAADARG